MRSVTMAEHRKVVITCAITGSIHTPSMSPHLPVTPKQIADAAVAAAEAGAAIVHLHARDPIDGHPTQDPKYFREFAADIARRSDVVINFTTGGAATMTIEERLQPARQLKPEVASVNGCAFTRARRHQAAALHPERLRHPRRHRPAPRRRCAHEAHGRSLVR